MFKPLFLQIPLPNFEIICNKNCSPNIYLKLFFQAPPRIQPLSCSKFELNILGSGCFQSNFIKPANLNRFFSYFCSQNAKFAQQQSCISDIWNSPNNKVVYLTFGYIFIFRHKFKFNLHIDKICSLTDSICQWQTQFANDRLNNATRSFD